MAPYQIFFPLGLFNAILAVGVWFVQNLGWFESPAILIHSKLIAGGFLWCFIVGFLMTAIPKMSGTPSARIYEILIAFILLFGGTVSAWQIDGRYFYTIQICLIFFLMFYGCRRILSMTKKIPVFFSHVGIAMLLALSGAYFHFQGNSFLGLHLYHLGAVLLLVLGIGTRFFSFLSGLPSVFENESSQALRLIFHCSGLVIGVLLYLAGSGYTLSYLGLSLVSLVYLFKVWQVQRISNRSSALKFCVRIAAAAIPLSFFLTWLQPHMYVTWFHLLFIGCFGLVTLSVATRVTLAHGSYPTDLELKSPSLWWMTLFLAFGGVFRIIYGYSNSFSKTMYLHLAAMFWVLAISAWGYGFFVKIFKPGPQSKPSC